MVLTAVLMLGIASFFRPMQSIFTTASVLDSQQTAAEGINTYICESLRYASNVGIYNSISGRTEINDFIDKVKIKTGEDIDLDDDIYMMTIVNNSADVDAHGYYGHVFMEKPPSHSKYEALGRAYYGRHSYQFDISVSSNKLTVTTSVLNSAGDTELTSKSSCVFANSSIRNSGYFPGDYTGVAGGEEYYIILYTMPH